MHIIYCWLVLSTPLKNMKVCWDDYSQDMEKHVPNHQPANIQKLGGQENGWLKAYE
jgi:hypothetical protein